MSEAKHHTPGPMTQGASSAGKTCVWLGGATEPPHEMGPDTTWIDCNTEANARRIAACWNACEGIDTGMLENITTLGDTLASRFRMRDKVERDLSAQRDELLAALIAITTTRCDGMDITPINDAWDMATAAIAKATGQEEGQ